MGRKTKSKKKGGGGGSSNFGIDKQAVENIYRKKPLEKETTESFLARGGSITKIKGKGGKK